eukprot:5199739-Pyramimonas_sp.AAC.1
MPPSPTGSQPRARSGATRPGKQRRCPRQMKTWQEPADGGPVEPLLQTAVSQPALRHACDPLRAQRDGLTQKPPAASRLGDQKGGGWKQHNDLQSGSRRTERNQHNDGKGERER